MRKFIVNLFSNRFGIVLATLNACYLANVAFTKQMLMPGVSEKIFLSINAPGLILAVLSGDIAQKVFPILKSLNTPAAAFALMTFFMVSQWLFIAWIAKTLARRFGPQEL